MSEHDRAPLSYDPLGIQVEHVEPEIQAAAYDLLEQAELKVPVTEVPFVRRMRVITEGGDFEFQTIPWGSEPTPERDRPLLCVRRNKQGELLERMDSNLFILEGMSAGSIMRIPEDVGNIAPGYNIRYRPVQTESQYQSLEYQLATEDERNLLHEAGWVRPVGGWPVLIMPSIVPHFTQPVTHFDLYGIDQVPARLF